MATSTLPKKLQMKAGQRAIVINAPTDYLEGLAPLPEEVELATEPQGQFDFVQVFVKNLADVEKFVPEAAKLVKHDALLWIAYPKGGAKAGTDLNRDILWNAVAPYNLTGVTLISLDDVWSCMRFRPSERVGQ